MAIRIPFEEWELQDALNAVRVYKADWVRINLEFLKGNHWQKGKGWTGPVPSLQYADLRTRVLGEIEKKFVSQNAVREATWRVVNAILGRDVTWKVVPDRVVDEENPITEDEQAIINEAEGVLTPWWDDHKVLTMMQNSAADGLNTERGLARTYVPSGMLDYDEETGEITLPDVSTMSEAMQYVHVMRIEDPTQAAVIVDEDTKREVGVYVYMKDGYQCAEITYLDENGDTVIRVLRNPVRQRRARETELPTLEEIRLPLNGHLTINQLDMPLLISQQVRENQMQLNKSHTLVSHNVDLAGFMRQVMLNAQRPKDDEINTGPGFIEFYTGITYQDEQDRTQVATPSVAWQNPVDINTFLQAKASAYEAILHETNQLHAILTGESQPSAESRRQALADFITSILTPKSRIDRHGAWLLETALRTGAWILGDPGRYDGFRIEFATKIYVGPLSADDLDAIIKRLDAKLLSIEDAMVETGVDDPIAMKAKILAEREEFGAVDQEVGAALARSFAEGAI
jgi:hypothetical protein